MDINAESNLSLWAKYMRNGDFESAWKVRDSSLQLNGDKSTWHQPRHLQLIWNGKTTLEKKKVLIRCYHGLGDTIQFIRYVPIVNKIASETVTWVQPELIRLLSTIKGIGKLMLLHNGTPEYDYDVDIELMELPHYFRTTLNTIPGEVPYINVNPLPYGGNGELNIGIVWKAGDWDADRSIPFHYLLPLSDIQGIRLNILQRGEGLNEKVKGFGIINGSDDIYEAAQIIKSLNLIISVDTMPAHLAGALGVPVWNLIHSSADWRWMEKGNDNPWYPTMRLFRQKEKGNWKPVIAEVCSELRKLFEKNNFHENKISSNLSLKK